MTDLQAALGLVQLTRLDELVERRRTLARTYQQAFDDLDELATAADPSYGTTNFQSFWIQLAADAPVERNALLEALAAQGVSARRGIMAAHLEPAYEASGPWCLPVTHTVTERSLILPIFHQMTDAEQHHVIDVVRAAFRAGRAA
jgi:dTDP-4-amino-4,6-dideoxygalactose transaminase